MKNKEKIIKEIKKIKSIIELNFDVESIGIFGSYAREQQNENSDLDILVELKKESKLSLLGLCKFENWLSEKLGIKVDLVLKSTLKPKIGKEILKEVIYL